MEKNKEEKVITKRIYAKEKNIKVLTTKYLELIKKFKVAARNEMQSILDEILKEIDLIEINTLKAKNIEILRENEKKIYLDEKNKISNNINNAKEEIIKKKKELYEAKKHREYLIKCEEIAKEINKYEPPKLLNEKIKEITKENSEIIKNKDELDKNLKNNEDKINKILEIVSEVKSSFSQINNNINNSINNNLKK